MANPQKEDGHTDIAHEIVEAIARTNFTAYETRLLMALFRKTYGWHKKEDAISLSQFSEITKISSQHCSRTLQRLELRNVIIISRNGNSNKYCFQKNYERWDKLQIPNEVVPNEVVPNGILPEQVVPIEDSGTTQRGNQVVPNEVVTKDSITKETIQKITTTTDEKFKKIVNSYENNIGMINPNIVNELIAISDEYKSEWFEEAVKEACNNNARKLSYIKAILERWRVDGFKTKKQGDKKNAYKGQPGNKPAGAFSDIEA
jgi:phage replication O-like protein O